MSRFTEALELARAGFKATEIRQMWEDKDNDPDPKKEPEPKKDQDTQKETDPPAGDPQPDLKYQELEDKYNKLLEKYQQMNIREDISGNSKSNEEDALDIMASMIGG